MQTVVPPNVNQLYRIIFFAVFGAVIGKQSGRSIEMLNSYELVTNEVEGDVIIDTAYYEMKSEQCK